MSVPTPEEIEYFLAHKDDTRQPNLIATVVTCLFFGYLAVVLRIVARHKRNVKLLTDDWLIICALVRSNPDCKIPYLYALDTNVVHARRDGICCLSWNGKARHLRIKYGGIRTSEHSLPSTYDKSLKTFKTVRNCHRD
jgi:hypothetical protein